MIKSVLFCSKVWILLIIFASHVLYAQVNASDFYDSFVLDPEYCNKELKVIKTIYTQYNCVSFVMDQSKSIFIIKQPKEPVFVELLHFLREQLGAYVAQINDIPASRVKIIPAGYAMPGKKYTHIPATFHTVVPGQSMFQLSDLPEGFIRLKDGFTRDIIHNMSLHPYFPVIVALDTFIGNNDRGTTNFFYDELSDNFWLIDFGCSFGNKLGRFASNYIKTLLKDKSCYFSTQELNGLIVYRNMLQNLITKHCPEELVNMLYTFANQAGVKVGSALYNDAVAEKIQWHEEKIFQNDRDTKRLVSLLDKLIDRYSGDKNLESITHQKMSFFPIKPKNYTVSDNKILYDTDLNCSRDQFNYISDRIQAYSYALLMSGAIALLVSYD